MAQDIEIKSTLLRFWQFTPTNRTYLLSWLYHQVGFAIGASDRIDFDSFNFFRVKASHRISQGQKVLALVV